MQRVGDRDRGGQEVKNLEFAGAPDSPSLKLTPFYRDFIENLQFAGQKSKSSQVFKRKLSERVPLY